MKHATPFDTSAFAATEPSWGEVSMSQHIENAARAIAEADALFIGAGAGMGVDSGLPDFRGNEGFWNAYPPFRELDLSFVELANPAWFATDPELAWGFYGHRLHLYRDTEPHAGFGLLAKWSQLKPGGAFVFTSNVDGHFQGAGFADEVICECHGSIHQLQCTNPCAEDIWSAEDEDVAIDDRFRARAPLPHCRRCEALARPNILMFNDGGWIESRAAEQLERMREFLDSTRHARLVVLELGAGTAVPTVRWQCERVAAAADATLVRINPREFEGPQRTLPICAGALEALQAIDELL